MNEMSSFKPSRFVSLRATTPEPASWEAIVSELTGDTHASATRSFREICRALTEAERNGDKPRAELLKERKSRIKQGQPAIIASVSLKGGRTVSHVTGYSGFVMVDIDGIEPGRFATVLSLVRDDPHTFLAHTTISGNGIRVFARMEGEIDSRGFKLAWQTVNDHYARLANVDIDRQCKNATRMSVLCHDPGAVFRPEAIPFHRPTPKADERTDKRRGRKISARRGRSHRTPPRGGGGRTLRAARPQQLHLPLPLLDEPVRDTGSRGRRMGGGDLHRLRPRRHPFHPPELLRAHRRARHATDTSVRAGRIRRKKERTPPWRRWSAS